MTRTDHGESGRRGASGTSGSVFCCPSPHPVADCWPYAIRCRTKCRCVVLFPPVCHTRRDPAATLIIHGGADFSQPWLAELNSTFEK